MAGYTDHAFRQTCRLLGAGMTYTEMISAKAMHFKDQTGVNRHKHGLPGAEGRE